MTPLYLVRFYHPDVGARLGLRVEDQVYDLGDRFTSMSDWLQRSVRRVDDAIQELDKFAKQAVRAFPAVTFDLAPSDTTPHWLAPVDEQEVWAAGVTYERSRAARQEEARDGGDIYARVYTAERPELFFKAHGRSVVGDRGKVGIRRDATWSVPEPELVLVMNPAMEIVGFGVGNDMSSRDIEGANPLYLPQAKVYTASCAMGANLLLKPANEWIAATIRLRIERDQKAAFEGDVPTSRIKRKIGELLEYLGRCNQYRNGVALFTGTGIVPPGDFTLQAGDIVQISIEGVGTLTNTVMEV
jgi:2-dehydro-3-deoxy-D-arabinonate dehydratase